MAEIEALDGVEIDGSVLRLGELKAASYAEQHHFELHLERDGAVTDRPVLHGLASAGRPSAHIPGWIDGGYGGVAVYPDDRLTLSDAGLERPLFQAIGYTLAPGGWLGLAYETFGEDTPLLRETRRALDLGVPPVATPIGLLLHHAGCGLHIRNWYISEGWREGPRKLQGYRPSNEESRAKHAAETRERLQTFLAAEGSAPELEAARERAREVLADL